MTNEEIKALLRELSETADAAGVSKKVRITFDPKRREEPEEEASAEAPAKEEPGEDTLREAFFEEPSKEDPAGTSRESEEDQGSLSGNDPEIETQHGRPDPEGTVYYDASKENSREQKTGRKGSRQIPKEQKTGRKDSRQIPKEQKTGRKGRVQIPVEPPQFEKDAADFRDNVTEAAAEAKESQKIHQARERVAAFKEKLSAKGIGKKQILIAAAVLVLAAVLAGVILHLLGNRAKSEHVTADEGLRILVQREPSRWCQGGTVTLEIRTDEPMQSITVDGNATACSGEKKTQLTFETTQQTADVMVVTEEQVLHALVDFPKIDREAPTVRVEEQDGLVSLRAEDGRSGVDQVWCGTIDGLSDVPAYQLYTEPFKPEEGKLYAYFAKDKAGNQSPRVTTNLTQASEISLPRQEISLFQGETWQMELEISPANAFLNDLEWTSSNPDAASVDQNGLVTALSDGETVIEAKASGVKSVSCLIRVRSEVDLTISAAGDCTLGDDINFNPMNSFSTVHSMYGSSYFLENVRSIFESDDITFVNLEGTLTDQGTRENKQYAFRGDPSYVQILTGGSVEAVTLANNHSSDYGPTSLTDTEKYLDQAGVEYCNGDKIIVKDVNGVRIGLIGIYVLAEGEAKAEQVQRTIAAAREDGAQVVVVAFHWGSEMETSPDKTQQTLAHLAIDSGADLVVGHHPHVLQGIEKYSGKYICYSLGNFCFGGTSNPSDMDTMIFRQTFKVLRGGVVESGDAAVIPCSISSVSDWNNYQPTPASGEEKDRIMEKINQLSEPFQTSF